jgi:hypothetical protein
MISGGARRVLGCLREVRRSSRGPTASPSIRGLSTEGPRTALAIRPLVVDAEMT